MLVNRGKISSDSNVWLVDDGSIDATWSIIESLAARSATIVWMKLTRNCGHQIALLAGLLSDRQEMQSSLDSWNARNGPYVHACLSLPGEGPRSGRVVSGISGQLPSKLFQLKPACIFER